MKLAESVAGIFSAVFSAPNFDTLAGSPGFGQVVETEHTDPLGHASASHTDGAGRTLATIDAEGNSTTYSFDANSNLVSFRDPNGVGEDCGYDLRDRKELCRDTQEIAEGTSRIYGYDANSNLVLTRDGPRRCQEHSSAAMLGSWDAPSELTPPTSCITQ